VEDGLDAECSMHRMNQNWLKVMTAKLRRRRRLCGRRIDKWEYNIKTSQRNGSDGGLFSNIMNNLEYV
jgi:hypothetical protein